MRSLARRVVRYVGRRGAYLLFLALLDAIIAYSMTQPLPLAGLTKPMIYAPFVAIMPLNWWITIWVAVSVICFTGAVWPRTQPIAFATAAGFMMIWGAGYLIGYFKHDVLYSRGYQTSTIYVGFAVITVLISGWTENQR